VGLAQHLAKTQRTIRGRAGDGGRNCESSGRSPRTYSRIVLTRDERFHHLKANCCLPRSRKRIADIGPAPRALREACWPPMLRALHRRWRHHGAVTRSPTRVSGNGYQADDEVGATLFDNSAQARVECSVQRVGPAACSPPECFPPPSPSANWCRPTSRSERGRGARTLSLRGYAISRPRLADPDRRCHKVLTQATTIIGAANTAGRVACTTTQQAAGVQQQQPCGRIRLVTFYQPVSAPSIIEAW